MNKLIASWYSNILALIHLVVVGFLALATLMMLFSSNIELGAGRGFAAEFGLLGIVGVLFFYVLVFGLLSVVVDLRRIGEEQLRLTELMREQLRKEIRYQTDGISDSDIKPITSGPQDEASIWNNVEALKSHNQNK